MWPWSYGSWICNYMCNQCLSPLTLWIRILLRRGVHDTTLCDKVCHWLAAGRWFSPGTRVSSPNKTDCHNITEILLKVVLSTINQTTIALNWPGFPSIVHVYLGISDDFEAHVALILMYFWHFCITNLLIILIFID